MELSVIILNYKVPYHLLQCIESVSKAIEGLSAEIIVVDNHSQDESCDLVRAYFPEVNLIAHQRNDGFSKGNNIGIAQAKGKYICLLNPDTAVGAGCFKNLLLFAKNHPDFGAIGPKLIDGRGNFLPESKRNVPTPMIALKKLFNNSDAYYSDIGENESGKIDVLVGAFMLMRKDRYLEVGGLDEDYFMYGEDIDLSYKLLKAGYPNYYVGSETVLHYKGESTARDATYRKRFYGAMIIFYQKHFESNRLSRYFVQAGLHLARITHSLRKKEEPEESLKRSYIVVDQNSDLKNQLSSKISEPLEWINLDDFKKETPQQSVLIFNAAALGYEDIFAEMKRLNAHDNLFRIKPAQLPVVIGSDNTTAQGRVLKL